MNTKYYNVFIGLLMAGTFLFAPKAMAQAGDTLLVEWADADGIPITNALRDAVLGDTTATGERASANRVYKLRRGGFYFLTERIVNEGFHLSIVGESSPTATAPPVIMKLNREDGTVDAKLLVGQGDVTLKNLVVNGRSDQGNLPYEVIRFDAPESRITIDNVIFEFAQWGIMAVYGKNSDVFVTNSHWRNLVSEAQKWGGRGMSVWTDADTLYFENNTYFNVGAVPLQVEGGNANFLWFNHNTLVNIGRNMMWGSWWREAYVANNLIVNGFWHGEEETDFNAERFAQTRSDFSGMFGVTPIPSAYGLDIERQIALVNNATYIDQPVMDWMSATSGDINPEFPDFNFGSIRPQPLINDSTKYFFDNWDNLLYDNHIEGVDPGLVNAGSDNYQNMFDFITGIRNGDAELTFWYWDPGRADANISVNWPLPEDLSYTNTQIMEGAVGGFPLGNLNWFPAEKAMWEGQQDALAAEIQGLVTSAGSGVLFSTTQAEVSTITGEAQVAEATDTLYADVRSAGSILWTFTLEEAGTFDVAVESRSVFGEKYQRLFVNGTEVIGSGGGGEAIHVVDNGPDLWYNVVIPGVAFNAGENTLSIVPSWGFSHHRDVFLLDGAGETANTLSVVDAAVDLITLECDGDACAQGNEFIDLGVGSATWNLEVDAGGDYMLRVYYKSSAGVSADVSVNGEIAAMGVNFGVNEGDWASTDVFGIALNAGVNQVELATATAGLQIDYVELFKIEGVTGTNTERDELPDGFELSQNFPNPFNPTTTITYTLGEASPARLVVYDLLGRQVRVLTDAFQAAGIHEVAWDGRSADGQQVSSGVYFYRLETEVGQQTRQMVLLK